MIILKFGLHQSSLFAKLTQEIPSRLSRVYKKDIRAETMPTTSVKHADFIGEPMGEKEVTALAGVGEVYGKKLASQGFDKAYVVLGQFLLLKKEKDLFMDWLKEVAGITKHHSEACYNCLFEWCEQHL